MKVGRCIHPSGDAGSAAGAGRYPMSELMCRRFRTLISSRAPIQVTFFFFLIPLPHTLPQISILVHQSLFQHLGHPLRLWERRREICVENKVRVLYNNNTFKKNVGSQGNAMPCHKDRNHVNDNISNIYLDVFTSASLSIQGFHAHRIKRSAMVSCHRGPNCPYEKAYSTRRWTPPEKGNPSTDRKSRKSELFNFDSVLHPKLVCVLITCQISPAELSTSHSSLIRHIQILATENHLFSSGSLLLAR